MSYDKKGYEYHDKNENIAKVFHQNKRMLIGVLILSIVGSIAFTAYKINKKSQQEKFSTMLHQSMIDQQLGDIEKSKKILIDISESSAAPSGVKSLALMRYAAILLDDGNKDEAIKIYKNLSKCFNCDSYIKELSGLLMARTLLTDEKLLNDEDYLKAIVEIENSAKNLRYHIAEQRGYIEMNKNNLEKAYQIFEMIAKSPEIKENLKERANDGMRIVTQKGYKPQIATN